MAEGGTVDNSSDFSYDFLCTNCSEDGDNSEAVNYCSQCQSYFCSKCIKMHNRLPATKNHTLVDKDKFKEGMEKKPISELTVDDKPGDNIADIHCLEELRVTDKQGMSAYRSETTEEEKNSIKKSFLKYGINGLKQYIEKGLNQWKTVKLNIAITGTSGAGKSTFINAIRDLNGEDEGAAKAGVVETTTEPKPYLHPKNKNFVFWDLPGIGTETFKAKTYIKDVSFETYDFFIILISGRFTENDMLLAKNVHAQGKRCYLVRTKIDVELDNQKKAQPNSFNRDALLQSMRGDCDKIVGEANLPCKAYLIDSYNKLEFDFGLLLKDIMESSFSLYREAFALSMSAVTNEVVEEKRNAILARAKRTITLYQIVFGALNTIFLGNVHRLEMVECFTVEKLLAETNEFRAQLGLTNEDLKIHAITLDMPLEDLMKKLHLRKHLGEFRFKIIKYKYIYDTSPLRTLPILADISSVKPNIQNLEAEFETLLNCMVDDAKTINRLKTSRLVEKTVKL